MRDLGTRRAAILLALLVAAAPCPAQDTDPASDTIREEIARATSLLESGDTREAAALLERIERWAPRDRQLRFLKAHLAIRQGRRDQATALLRGLLADDPSLLRVRLDLARTLYETGDYAAATYHFELALGADLPDTVRRNVLAYLDALRHAETYLNLRASIVDDSNANQGPRSSTVNLFGVPFTVAEDARPKRATGVFINAAGRLALGEDRRWYLLANLEDREYGESSLSYLMTQIGLGHSIPLENGRIGAEAGYYDSRFRGSALSGGAWARTYASREVAPGAWISPSLLWRESRYPNYPYLSGDQLSAALDASKAATTSLLLTAGLLAGRTSAADALWSHDSTELRLGARKELPYGLIADLRFADARAKYDAEDALFATVRRDRNRRLELELSQRRWSIRNYVPTLYLAHIRNDSNIALYSWRRDVVGIGANTRF